MIKGWFTRSKPWWRWLAILVLAGLVFSLGGNPSSIYAQDVPHSEPGEPAPAEAKIPPAPLGGGGPNHWYTVVGAVFVPSGSSITYNYGNSGCLSASVSGYWRASVNLPDGTTLKYISFTYYNSATSSNTGATLTRYSYDGNFQDLASVTARTGSVTGAGYFQDFSAEFTEVVDNATYGYTFIWSGIGTATPPATANQRLCSVRVGYIPASPFALALPAVQR